MGEFLYVDQITDLRESDSTTEYEPTIVTLHRNIPHCPTCPLLTLCRVEPEAIALGDSCTDASSKLERQICLAENQVLANVVADNMTIEADHTSTRINNGIN